MKKKTYQTLGIILLALSLVGSMGMIRYVVNQTGAYGTPLEIITSLIIGILTFLSLIYGVEFMIKGYK